MSNLENFPPSPDIPNVEGIKDPFTFQKFCIRIGAIPSSYTEAMTIEEQILYFIDFLQNTVIPAVNINADTVNELIAQFTDLYNYVHNYFDNLDVQEEINTKLDQMTQDGTLQQIMNSYLTNCFITYNTVQDMKNYQNHIEGTRIKTLGFYTIGDGGNASYIVKSGLVANEMNIIALNNGLCAELLIDFPKLDVRKLGAKNDDTFDNTNILTFANTFNLPILLVGGTFKITQVINMTQSIEGMDSIIKMYGAGGTGNNRCLFYKDVENKYVKNLEFNGGWNGTQLQVAQQFDEAIRLESCSDFVIENNIIYDMVGDGISLSTSQITKNPCKKIRIINNNISHCWRNGLSVINGDDIFISKNYIEQLDGFLMTVDIEPNKNVYETVKNLTIIDNILINKNETPVLNFTPTVINLFDPNQKFENFKILNNTIKGQIGYGIYGDVTSNINSLIISNNIIELEKGLPFRIRKSDYLSICNNNIIQNCELNDILPNKLVSIGLDMDASTLEFCNNNYKGTSTLYCNGIDFNVISNNIINHLFTNGYYALQCNSLNSKIDNNILNKCCLGIYITIAGQDSINSLTISNNSFINMIKNGSATITAINIVKQCNYATAYGNTFDGTVENISNNLVGILPTIPLNLAKQDVTTAYSKPTTGTFYRGDIVLNRGYTSTNKILGWICTSGNPLTWLELKTN